MLLSISGLALKRSSKRTFHFRLLVAFSIASLVIQSCFAASSQKRSADLIVHEGTDMALTVSPDRNWIIIDLQGLLYKLPISGGVRAERLTSPELEASHPSWSPKGDVVAIQSYSGGTFHIWTMKPDGSGLHQITTGHGDDREPAFSPDGKTIAFASDRAFQGSYDIWTVDLATGTLKQWTSSEADEYEPAWSPDGSEIAYVSGVGIAGKKIEAVTAIGTVRAVAGLSGKDGRLEAPAFSPDGKKISYTEFSGSGIFMSASHLMISGSPLGKNDDAFPFPAAWLFSDELIYAANGHIFRANISTAAEKQIDFSAAIPSMRSAYTHKHFDFDSTADRPVKGILAPALSPDGQQIAFIAINQLWAMKIGGAPRQLKHDSFYKQGSQWSPDGRWIAYVSDKDGTENIYLLDPITGEEKHPAPSSTSAQIFPSWSPDGKWIAFQDQTGVTSTLEIETGKVHPLTAVLFAPGRPSWSADGKLIAMSAVKPYTRRFREGTSQILTIDVASGKTQFFEPEPFESITTRGEDGPVYSPDGKEMAFILHDLLYVMPVDTNGKPSGPPVALSQETADAPTWSGDSKHLLYISNGKLRLIARETREITSIELPLSYHRSLPQQSMLIHAGRFWKGQGEKEETDVDILVAGNRIVSITPHNAAAHRSAHRVVDASAYTVLPGLWENHVHPSSLGSVYYGDRMGRLWLAYGITELRDMADQAYRAAEQREALDSGARVGPRLFPTGEAIDGERVYYSMMIPTTSQAQLQRELVRLKALDFDLVKLYVRLPYAWQVKAIHFAHQEMGVETASHYLLPAVALDSDGMSHISATARTGYAYSRSFIGRSYEDVRTLLAGSGMFTISTTFSPSLYAEDPAMPDDSRQLVSPPWERKRLATMRDNAVKEDSADGLKRLDAEESTVAETYRKQGLILAGTDSPLDMPATSLHLNLRSQVKFGLQPWQALETVTYLPAKAYGLLTDLGTLEKGKLADLIIVSGDPLQHIEDAAKVQCVMKNGELLSVGNIIAPFAPGNSTGQQVCNVQ